MNWSRIKWIICTIIARWSYTDGVLHWLSTNTLGLSLCSSKIAILVLFKIDQKDFKNYGLDCSYYYTAPGLSWDAMLKYTKIESFNYYWDQQNMEQVAKAIGYIVYAVASADKHVAEEEKKIAHDLINEHWTLLADNEDPFGVRALDFVDKIIVSFDEDHLDSEKAFESFQAIYTERNKDFKKEINR